MTMTGIMVCGHGSRDVEAITEFSQVAEGLRSRFPDTPVEYGFLEFARPIIRDGLEALVGRGVDSILAVPGMLLAAGHVKNDIVSVLNDYKAEREGAGQAVEFGFGRALDVDPRLLQAARDRIEEAEGASAQVVTRAETLLMVVGRGTSDPDANGDIAKIARMIGEGMGFGWTEVSYSGVAFPLVAPGLEHAVKLGYQRIIVFPYFLFTGILVKRIYSIADEIAALNPSIEFLKAPYLNDHPLVLETFTSRVSGIREGDNTMNCMSCKYREQVIGFEADQGAPQVGHHHHVQGIGTNADKADDHGHSHEAAGDGGHTHTHTPHPHTDHPHGPGQRSPERV